MKTLPEVYVVKEPFSQGVWGTLNAYFLLTKPRIIVLLIISTAGGSLAAGSGSMPLGIGIALLVGGYLCAGGAGAMNCYLDRELDLLMSRTKNRPLPAGLIRPRNALIFSIVISTLSIPVFLMVNVLVALLGAAAWAYYVLFYSVFLKRRTSQNILWGGAAGAVPPLIGWVGVSGTIDLSAISLFLIVFFWTPPHAYALMLVLKEDYTKVNVPMLPVVHGDKETKRQILIYSVVLLAITIFPVVVGLFGPLYLATSVVTGVILVGLAVVLYRSISSIWAIRVFRYSTFYLALLFLGLVIDRSIFG